MNTENTTMTQAQQPEALRMADALEKYSLNSLLSPLMELAAELRRQHARITELESQLAQRFDAADVATDSAQGFRDGWTAAQAISAEPAGATEMEKLATHGCRLAGACTTCGAQLGGVSPLGNRGRCAS